jgi:outer membrane protein insertion porin family
MKNKICFLLFGLLFLPLSAFADQEMIKAVTVEGAKIIEKGAILSKIDTKVGTILEGKKIAEDIKRIYKMGFFSDIYFEKEEKDGGVLIKLIVREKPYIREIKFTGNKDSSEDDLKALIATKRYSFLDERKINADDEKIKKHYQDKGFYFVTVGHKVEPVKDKPADMQAVFVINEGKKVKISKIIINGIKNISQRRIKKEMETKEKWFLSWLTGSGTYKIEELKDDFERVREFYGNEGFIEAKVTGHKVYLNEKKNGLIVDVEIYEGKRYKVSDVKVGGDAKEHEALIIPKLKQKKNEFFKRSNIRNDMNIVGDFMGDKGYAYANIEPMMNVNEEKSSIELTYYSSKGKLVYINRFAIEGNNKTRDHVIRRELSLSEGELYNASKIKKSKNKINRLGFFEEANFIPQRVEYEKAENEEEDLMDMLIKVKERPTGYLTFGVGYSSVDAFMASIQISQNNLFGKGQKLTGSVQASSRAQTYSISFLEPYLLGYPVSGGFDVFKTYREYTDYTKDSTGFGLRSGYRINDDWGVSGGYRYEIAEVSNVALIASKSIRDQIGTKLTSSVHASLSRDTRNDAVYPTEGSSFSYSMELAGGVLGGDNYFIRNVVDGAKYYLLPWEHTLSFHGQYGTVSGYGGKVVPIYEKFFLGGMYNLRGFDSRSLAPRDPVTGDVLGGNKELFGNVEYILPLIKEAGVKWLFFLDAGNAYDSGFLPNEFRYSAGMGIRWYSPMGPLRLEWGKNLKPKDNEKSSRWEFSIGTVF